MWSFGSNKRPHGDRCFVLFLVLISSAWRLLLCKQIDYASPKYDQRNAEDQAIKLHRLVFLALVVGVGGKKRNRNEGGQCRYSGRLISMVFVIRTGR